MSDVGDRRRQLRQLVDGYRISQGIAVAAQLGIADQLADGERSSAELAAATGADADALYRLLRALATVDLLHESDGRRFSLTPLGEGLRADVEDSLHGWATYTGSAAYWAAWGDLAHSVRTGANAFQHVHGTDVWTYRSTRPAESAMFDRAMVSLSGQGARDAVAGYDFTPFGTIADIGGGVGAFLSRILVAAPGVRGVLFDQPHVVAGAFAVLEAAGVADRCAVVGGSFFDAIPSGADLYVLRSVVHDWEDHDAVRVLESVRRAVPDHGTLVLVERIVAGPNEGGATKWSDLNMLVAPGGRERTQAEFDDLFGRTGFRPTRTVVAGPTHWFVEATPV
jgi:O-methyltransferase domain/Dimerisation domain